MADTSAKSARVKLLEPMVYDWCAVAIEVKHVFHVVSMVLIVVASKCKNRPEGLSISLIDTQTSLNVN